MASSYLQSSEYNTYGVPGSTTAAQVLSASAVIDSYLKRPEGLVYSPDANGNPCYMTGKTASVTLTATGAISTGKNINVTVTGGIAAIQEGFVAVLDRADPTKTEACIVTSINGNVITLANVQFAHNANALLEFGLTILEEKQMPSGRPLTVLSRSPVIAILAGQGRYGYERRGDSNDFILNDFNLLATLTAFGGPPVWEQFDVTKAGINPESGEVWVPAGVMLAYYSDVRLSYIAGFQYSNLPAEIKLACANVISAASNMPLSGSIKSMKAGDTGLERFAANYLDENTKDMLNPYRARCFV
jgi:hypothetical protein